MSPENSAKSRGDDDFGFGVYPIKNELPKSTPTSPQVIKWGWSSCNTAKAQVVAEPEKSVNSIAAPLSPENPDIVALEAHLRGLHAKLLADMKAIDDEDDDEDDEEVEEQEQDHEQEGLPVNPWLVGLAGLTGLLGLAAAPFRGTFKAVAAESSLDIAEWKRREQKRRDEDDFIRRLKR